MRPFMISFGGVCCGDADEWALAVGIRFGCKLKRGRNQVLRCEPMKL